MTSEQLSWIIKREAIEMTNHSGASHIGSILSVSDLIAVLINDFAKLDPKNIKSEDRDRIILSKGHAGASLYISLAMKGFFETDLLKTYEDNGSILSGHVSHKTVPGIEFSTGSLGHGLSVACGMAFALKLKKNHNSKVYAILGDGECDEGSIWEAVLFANHFCLNNLIAIVDHNKMQSLDYCEKTIKLDSLHEKFASFGWNVVDCSRGNNITSLQEAFRKAFKNSEASNKPVIIIAETTKGYGVSFMENDILWHYRYPHDGDEYLRAVSELEKIRPMGAVAPCEVEK